MEKRTGKNFKPSPAEWEERFDDLFFVECPTEIIKPFFWRWIKEGKEVLLDFIRSLLASHHQELKEKIEGMKTNEPGETGEYKDGFNSALDDVLNLLK